MRKSFLVATILLTPLCADAGSQVIARHAALASVSPQATQIGARILREGGNAIDAAVAVSFALAVAHPQAGNIGGGGFLLYYEKKSGAVWTLDYREVAPFEATSTMYLQADGKPKPEASTIGPLASGVPGSVAGLEAMHERFGRKKWSSIVTPAVRLAREGIVVTERLRSDLAEAQEKRKIDRFPSTAAIFFPDGKPLAAGTRLRQDALAETLERIAKGGANEFYEGTTARNIVRSVQEQAGLISQRDLTEYRPTWRAPVRIDYRDYQLYTMAPPGGGSIILSEVLAILNPYDIRGLGFQSAGFLHVFAEALRRAYIDRNEFVGDPAFVRIPFHDLYSAERAERWRSSIDPARATPTETIAKELSTESGETTHFTIVDEEGNIAAVTTTLNSFFGCGFVVEGGGFFLNNEMDDFTTAPGAPTAYGLVQSKANAIEPRKKMASSMTPTIVFRAGRPFLALGSPGGGSIPASVLQVFFNVAMFGQSLLEAVDAPRFHHQAHPDHIKYERGRADRDVLVALTLMGHAVHEEPSIGDVHAVMFTEDGLVAVADSRRGGAAGGY
ncbi:MAG TPA: gamma-glutamyltransferase [Thermoanaerobaculia bacterium]